MAAPTSAGSNTSTTLHVRYQSVPLSLLGLCTPASIFWRHISKSSEGYRGGRPDWPADHAAMSFFQWCEKAETVLTEHAWQYYTWQIQVT